MKFIIDRKTWLRGEGVKTSRLLRPSDGKMCCLGQIGEQCGISKRSLKDQVAPSSLVEKYITLQKKWPEPLRPTYPVHGQSSDINLPSCMMLVNDDISIGDGEREEKLTRLALKEGIELEFIN